MADKKSKTPADFVEKMAEAGFQVKPLDLSGISLDPSAGRPLFETVLLDSMLFRSFVRACVDDGFMPLELVPKPYRRKTVGFRNTRQLCLQAMTLFETPIFFLGMEEMDLMSGNDPIQNDPFKMLQFISEKLGVPWVMGSGFMSSLPFDSYEWLDVELDMRVVLPFLPFTIEWMRLYDPFYRKLPAKSIEALVFIRAAHDRERAITETSKCFPNLSRNEAKAFLRDTIARVFWYSTRHATYLKEATKNQATPYFCMNPPGTTELSHSKKEVQVFKLALASIAEGGLRVPEVNTLDAVAALREEPTIVQFRSKLSEWIDLVESADRNAIEEITRQVKDAESKMKALGKLTRMGEVLTYFALPVGIAELLIQIPVVGMSLAAVGIGLSLSTTRLKKELGWVRFVTGA